MKRFTITLFVVLIGLISAAAHAAQLIKIDGSSTVYPITEAVAEEFQKADRGKTRVTVGISGTGGGFKKFCGGETDISDASRPIKPTEVELCMKNGIEYIELPVAYDGLAVMVNPKNTWVDSMTVKELKKIWEPAAQGKVTKWSQVRPGWPDKEIHLFGPGVDSGTFDYFTEAIVGKGGSSRGDYTASEDDNVLVQGIATDALALGFFGVAYYDHNKDRLKLVPVDDENVANGIGPVFPEYENVVKGTYQPLARPIFIYINRKSADKSEVVKFVEFYMKNGAALSKEVGYISLPDKAYNIEKSGFKVITAKDGPEAIVLARKEKPDLIVLDIMLPSMEGTEVCKAVRKSEVTGHIPIIMLTAKSEEVDRIVGLELGADDYITKPFSPRELILRIKAVLKRGKGVDEKIHSLNAGPIHIDADKLSVTVDGKPVKLTSTEIRLLIELIKSIGRVLSRETLLDRVWGSEFYVTDRTVDTHITRLREKLGKASGYIETVRGFGYRFKEE